MEDKVLTFKIIDDDGKERECEEVYSFKREDLNKEYIIYTDNTKDEDGNIKLYGAIHGENNELIPITDDDEWANLEEMFEALEEGND